MVIDNGSTRTISKMLLHGLYHQNYELLEVAPIFCEKNMIMGGRFMTLVCL